MHDEIIRQLLEMERVDQEVRTKEPKTPADYVRWEQVDRLNTELLKSIVALIGWPTTSKVGAEGAAIAWLIAQHADHDIPFQKYCLELMIKEPETEVPEIDISYLYDRICVNEKRPQFFGTQFGHNSYGAYGPDPIELVELVNERRLALGMVDLATYKDELKKKYKITD